MREKIRDLVLSGVGGLIISYAAYFLMLQNLGMRSIVRLGLVISIFSFITALVFLLRKRFQFHQAALGGIAALFLLLNLVISVKVDFLDLPYTIALLPVQTIRLVPEQAKKPVEIKSYGTELYEDLNFDQLRIETEWALNNKGNLTQEEGTTVPIIWTGKPGQFIYFEVAPCVDCGVIQIESRDKTVSFSLDETALPPGRLTYQFPNLAWHKTLNFIALEGALLVLSCLLLTSAGLIQFTSRPREGLEKFSFLRRIPMDIWLVLLPLVVFGFKLTPVIFNDDWCQIIQPMHEGSFQFFDITARRPMHLSIHWLIYKIFPIHQAINAMQAAHLAAIILIGLVIYRLLKYLFEDKDWLALLGALLCIVYPSDYTYFYLSLLGTRFAFFFTLTAMFLFTRYMKTNRISSVWLAAALALTGLLTYEGQFGIYLAWPLVIGIIHSFKFFKEKIDGLAVYYFPALLFPVWRLIVQPLFYKDSKIVHLTEGFSGIITSINWGFRTILGGFWLSYRDTSWLTAKTIVILAASLVLCGLVCLAAKKAATVIEKAIDQAPENYPLLLAAGILLWGSGYIPIIINYPPNIWGHLSRVNIFAIPGAVLILIALFRMITGSLAWREGLSTSILIGSFTLLILVGTLAHVQAQQSFSTSWQETKSFYQQVIDLAPDVEQETEFYFYLHGESDTQTTHRPLITTFWEPRCAVEVFYDSAVKKVSYTYQHISVPAFPALNILGGNIDDEFLPKLFPEKLVGLSYNLQTGQVEIIEDISSYLGADFQDKYHPYDLIIPLEEENLSRKLID